MKNFKFTINGNQYEVNIIHIEDNIAEMEVNGTPYKVEVEKAIAQTKTPILVRPASVPSTDSHPSVMKTSNPDSPKGAGHIKSPLPGVILDVFVREGDIVKKGQKLLMLEAMKMENNIDSDKDGKVVSVKVQRGDSIMEGDILITIGE
ncbi:MAG: acetyl-CoA carboxylase biotin carboxyl carrier protein subunit [Bacteroidetes bacterium GWC2_33_15]|nr:MAG: acetyl-CoA carboxylase biotin carboxyl carrier protein subunit [Bacteroidetes bacterium GWA2_33_15]OFX51501.1 MAG: acetyl-CoA carboxylase biotin carboxyl carrier protein subunit [Bacteroidetes bacterium GWC2_33_15]OFX65752.1 MAG: acetyl-CoA carboxylase biotin carboxyl carrier protein subunit [Bacteroidetes bacterium GWB2_32_14]OFX69529.1 MAG: acetyl-CoA carboxylase biotin carboxyl carrier protein subunit [Bacteroidetes bacterium GWD2_33_33]HAN17789.1 acetyl-CoA carboxylase biotin carbox